MRLNLGCGRRPLDGWVNVDQHELPGVDIVADLDSPKPHLDLADESVDEIVGIDLIEHIRHPLPLMEELWRVAKPDARCTFALPYGSSDSAWTDPTHVRPYFIGSWAYFGQPHYWRADYGYRGDWRLENITLTVDDGMDDIDAVMTLRNVVQRQVAELTAVKPARPTDRALQTPPLVLFRKATE